MTKRYLLVTCYVKVTMASVGVTLRRTGTGKPRIKARYIWRKPAMPRGRSYVRIGTGRKRTA